MKAEFYAERTGRTIRDRANYGKGFREATTIQLTQLK